MLIFRQTSASVFVKVRYVVGVTVHKYVNGAESQPLIFCINFISLNFDFSTLLALQS